MLKYRFTPWGGVVAKGVCSNFVFEIRLRLVEKLYSVMTDEIHSREILFSLAAQQASRITLFG